ncbi:sensor histidine kinase [Aquabacterium sp.]|uniref:sensor histidine kinase n=1 Tax=Aquabacterium sp. TaxID=1872578 RepID=UPI002BAC892A|nr:sensor histidine kinase [Aquabacterium sp.]HSW05866.1 sensor histidine kinase [Aquabacterium sp.]
MIRHWLYRFVCVALGLAAWAPLQAQPLPPLKPAWQLLEDPGGRMTLEEAQARADEFRPSQRTGPLRTPGYTPTALWARLDLPAAEQPETLWLVMTLARIEHAQLWVETRDGRWQHAEAGLLVPHALWPLDTPSVSFALRPEPGRPLRLMLRESGRTLTSFDALLCRPQDCFANDRFTVLAVTVLAGNQMLAAAGYLLLFCIWRQAAFVLMAGSVAAYGLYELSLHGLAFQYLWPAATGWAPRSLVLLMGAAQLLNSLAVAAILPLRRAAGALRWALIAVWLAMTAALLAALWGDYRAAAPLVNAMTGLCGLLTLVLAGWACWRRLPMAGWAALVMGAAVAGALPRYAYVLGWLELGPVLWLTTPTVLLLSHLILLVALVQRVVRLRQSELIAQAQLLDERAARGRELEQQVEERTGQLRVALHDAGLLHQQRSRLLAYIGHDLRAPLAATVSYLRLLGGRGRRDQQLRASVEQGVAYQLALIDELVEFSRGELHELDLVPAPLYIHGLLHELAEQGALLARSRHNTFQAHIAAELPAVLVADAKRLRQLLLNLLSNAAKFTVNGQIELRVTPGAEPDGWRFEVADNGRGIAPEDQAHLFEPFWRAPPRADEESPPGSGLGLTVAQHITQAMGARLELHSAIGQGSRFAFELQLPAGRAEEVLLPGDGAGPLDDRPAEPGGERPEEGPLALLIDAPLNHADRVAELLFAANFEVARLETRSELRDAQLLLLDPALLDAADLLRLRQWRAGGPARRCIALIDRPPASGTAGLFDANLYKPVSAAALLAELSAVSAR